MSEVKRTGYAGIEATFISSCCSVNGEVATRVLQSQLKPALRTCIFPSSMLFEIESVCPAKRSCRYRLGVMLNEKISNIAKARIERMVRYLYKINCDALNVRKLSQKVVNPVSAKAKDRF